MLFFVLLCEKRSGEQSPMKILPCYCVKSKTSRSTDQIPFVECSRSKDSKCHSSTVDCIDGQRHRCPNKDHHAFDWDAVFEVTMLLETRLLRDRRLACKIMLHVSGANFQNLSHDLSLGLSSKFHERNSRPQTPEFPNLQNK